MKSQNIAILVLFILLLILLYQIYFKNTLLLNRKKPIICTPKNLQDIQNVIIDNRGKTFYVSVDPDPQYIPLSTDILISTNKLDAVISVDTENKQVTVECGCKIKDLCITLEKENLTLETIPNINQTIGGACSTAEHGSNLDSGTISDQIINITVVLANGHIRRIELEDPEFPAFITGLGSLAIIYSITLQCVDNYHIYATKNVGSWNNMKKTLFQQLDKYKSSELTINPTTLNTIGIFRRKINMGNPTIVDSKEYIEIYAEKPAKSYERNSSEVAVPYEYTVEAIDDTLLLCQNYDCERVTITFTGPDYNSWLSPASGRKTTWIKVHNASFSKEYEDLLLSKYSGRPNWSTSKNVNTYKTRLMYGISLDYVRKIKKQYDPDHTFIGYDIL